MESYIKAFVQIVLNYRGNKIDRLAAFPYESGTQNWKSMFYQNSNFITATELNCLIQRFRDRY